MKTCKHCKKQKDFDEFYKNDRMKSGFSSRCKDCAREYDRKRTADRKPKDDSVFNVDKEMSYLLDQTPNNIYSGLKGIDMPRIDHVYEDDNSSLYARKQAVIKWRQSKQTAA